MYAQRGDQTDIRTFRRLDSTETYGRSRSQCTCTDFEASALSRLRPPGPSAEIRSLVRDLAERVGLVEELRQLGSTEKRINNRTQCPGIDQIHRGEYLIVTDVITSRSRMRSTAQAIQRGQTYPELSVTAARLLLRFYDGCPSDQYHRFRPLALVSRTR